MDPTYLKWVNRLNIANPLKKLKKKILEKKKEFWDDNIAIRKCSFGSLWMDWG